MTSRKLVTAMMSLSVRSRCALVTIEALLFFPAVLNSAPASPVPSYQTASGNSEQEERYDQALQAYSQNRLSDARTFFEAVRGNHSDEAQKYVAKIKAYIEAMQLADSVMQRSPDELDLENLDFAITKYEEAISIKGDGPWQPNEKLQKAKDLRTRLLQQNRSSTEARDRELCQKALKAANARTYEQARLMACALSNDDPAYSCGGDEALHICQEMQDLAKLTPRKQDVTKKSSGTPPASDTGQQSSVETAKAAFDANNFQKARTLFQQVSGADTPSAQQYLEKIDHYEAAMKQGDNFARDTEYGDARAKYQEAANIKSDGPGRPQEQAALMVLEQGIDEFYSGHYSQAENLLATYTQESTQKKELAHFYNGACKLARFLISGSQDGSLREEALNDLRMAKKSGFHAKDLEVSPKILKIYQELTF